MSPFHIIVNPTGSKFAKTLQQNLRNKVINNVFRVPHPKRFRRTVPILFYVTPRVKNKIEQLEAFKRNNVTTPNFTTNRNRLNELGAKTIFARTLINSTNGRGIVEFDYGEQQNIPNAPLYTAYIPKKAEYRVHVFGGRVIDVQQKRKKRDFGDGRDTRIRNTANGYVYCRDNVVPDPRMSELAVRAVAALDYQYGAVDVIYNQKQDTFYVLEVNSRPGLMGTTVDKYSDALIQMFNLRRK
jgi:glutathione synthase/RimK-type ligase-like ATP-grasp enzyme